MTINYQDTEALLPRRYQEEIFSRAQDRNVIAALDTGSGKTYISTLLIKWIATRDAGLGKTIVFLVPKVALVEQQGDFIAKEAPLRWPLEQRPKIFGMTASPIWNPKDAAESLATLERNLDAKVIAVREHVDELADHSPKPQEIIQEYAAPPLHYKKYPATTLWERLKLSELPPTIDFPITKIQTRYDVTLHSLGPYGAELYLYTDIKNRITQWVSQAEDELDYRSSTNYDTLTFSREIQLPPELDHMQTVLSQFSDIFEDENDPDTVPIRIDTNWCSPKVILLSQLLFEHYRQDFQGIVFVEQRHVAACLSKMLPRIPPLELYFKSAQLIGHGASSLQKSQGKGMALRTQQDVVRMFRDREINLLIATSVAEEGLDFPACELVIRFDPIQHMVGYIQSRGRARQKTATFVVMVQEGQAAQLDRYKAFSESEPQLRLVYQTRDDAPAPVAEDELEEGEEREDPDDLAERQRYVVESTGAILTYNTSIGLLNHLCSLIPRDRFTPMHLPQYSGDFEATLRLPSSLPLPPDKLVYIGPPRRSKKEAKRAVAFEAVKALHKLGVFDDYLLPARASSGDNEDADGRLIGDVSSIPDTMDVMVRDPWTRGRKQWLHVVYLDGRPTAGLITGSILPPADLVCNGTYVNTSDGSRVEFDWRDEWQQRRALEDFMRMGLWWSITGRGITLPMTCYLVPITRSLEVDWDAIYKAIANPYGVADWSGVGEEHYGHLLIVCSKEHGRPLMLRRIRTDITPLSRPPPGSREAGYGTYRDYCLWKYTRKGVPPDVPFDGPCVEGQPFPRHTSTVYALDGSDTNQEVSANNNTHIYPLGLCRWAHLSEDVYHTFHILPELCHRITDLYRARTIRLELGLPPIADDILIQALTLPSANAGFNNQRLETLGDAVLKLSTVVHLFNRFPHRHEGQLDVLRRNSVSNRTLLARAKEIRLEQYLTSEPQTMRIWRYVLPADSDLSVQLPSRYVFRRIPKRSLQDCMEATLGAGFVTGGISMALCAGMALGLSFGGPIPWPIRYERRPESPVSPLFAELQETLGYQFTCGALLVEAVTHPSFRSIDSSSYQRLEFLGDALIDLVVMRYLYNKFPEANSGQLSWARSRSVCAPALASVAVNHLGLHKMLLVNNVELSIAIGKYIPILESTSSEEIIRNGWKHDPPKAISDVLESVLGAVFVDMNFDFEKAAVIVESVLQDLLVVLSPDMPRDPVSELMVWSAKAGCRKITFRKSQSRSELKKNDSVSIIVHDFAVVGPIPASNMSLAKGLASERAKQVLADPQGPYLLAAICDCNARAAVEEPPELAVIEEEPQKLDDETEEGFAALARIALTKIAGAEECQQDNVGIPVEDKDLEEEFRGPQIQNVVAADELGEQMMDLDSEDGLEDVPYKDESESLAKANEILDKFTYRETGNRLPIPVSSERLYGEPLRAYGLQPVSIFQACI
ncbi:hypothetical protein EW026_g6294 [Hermanssonia centrifuga]|uniref:Uncharacterized protein n=1 Tax=Hermanssonia centrifuga TaxID=98765 RepID=A0A4V3X9T1_9APHY|nr:hypothetical protein EW026_g6294 [Hermanssonia centrifuga]